MTNSTATTTATATNNTSGGGATTVWWNGDIVIAGVRALQGAAATVFLREARKLNPAPAFPINARGVESPELDWLPGTGAFRIHADRTEEVLYLIDYVEKM